MSVGADGIVIRPAIEADLPVLRRLWLEFEIWLNAIGEPEAIDAAKFDAFAALTFGEHSLCEVLLAEKNDEAVGYLVYHLGVWMDDMAPALFVADLFVRADMHRQGAGRALMHRARDIADIAGARHLFWTVWRKNAQARDFYRGLGAEVFDEEIFMRWAIAD